MKILKNLVFILMVVSSLVLVACTDGKESTSPRNPQVNGTENPEMNSEASQSEKASVSSPEATYKTVTLKTSAPFSSKVPIQSSAPVASKIPKPASPVSTKAPSIATKSPVQKIVASASIAPKVKVYTASELAKYDGQNGNPAYVAIDGKVYDVTNASAWRNGMHKGVSAGADLSEEINQSPHGKSVLTSLPVIGVFNK